MELDIEKLKVQASEVLGLSQKLTDLCADKTTLKAVSVYMPEKMKGFDTKNLRGWIIAGIDREIEATKAKIVALSREMAGVPEKMNLGEFMSPHMTPAHRAKLDESWRRASKEAPVENDTMAHAGSDEEDARRSPINSNFRGEVSVNPMAIECSSIAEVEAEIDRQSFKSGTDAAGILTR